MPIFIFHRRGWHVTCCVPPWLWITRAKTTSCHIPNPHINNKESWKFPTRSYPAYLISILMIQIRTYSNLSFYCDRYSVWCHITFVSISINNNFCQDCHIIQHFMLQLKSFLCHRHHFTVWVIQSQFNWAGSVHRVERTQCTCWLRWGL